MNLFKNLFDHKPKILLHVCCAGCGAHVAKFLSAKYKVIPFFYNPNISPESEYVDRKREFIKLCNTYGLKSDLGNYDHENWLMQVKGHEQDLEKGSRCEICYYERLKEAAQIAKEKKIKYFTSTLSVSPHKKYEIIKQIGDKLAKKMDLIFIDTDFKKEDGFKKSVELSKRYNFARQNYCGCEFSKRVN